MAAKADNPVNAVPLALTLSAASATTVRTTIPNPASNGHSTDDATNTDALSDLSDAVSDDASRTDAADDASDADAIADAPTTDDADVLLRPRHRP